MDSCQAIHQQQAQGQVPFFYYTPQPDAQNGHFTPHPNELQGYTSQGAAYRNYHHSPVYSQGAFYHQPIHSPVPPQTPYHASGNMPPLASPQPIHGKPTIIIQGSHSPALMPLDTSCAGPDMYHYFPSTPPLSATGSAISSPPSSCGILPTPVAGQFFTMDHFEGVKAGFESDVHSEILAQADWNRCGSPAMTPGKF